MAQSDEGAIGPAEVKARLSKLKASASPIEVHCASEMCRRDGADPEKPVRGFPLWLHYLPTVRNVLTIQRIAKEFEETSNG